MDRAPASRHCRSHLAADEAGPDDDHPRARGEPSVQGERIVDGPQGQCRSRAAALADRQSPRADTRGDDEPVEVTGGPVVEACLLYTSATEA